MQLRRGGASPGRRTDDADRTVSGGRSSRRTPPARVGGWSHRGAGGGADHFAPLAMAERVPLPPAPIATQRTPEPPLWSARARLLMPVAHNRIKFIEIALRFRQNRPDIPGLGN